MTCIKMKTAINVSTQKYVFLLSDYLNYYSKPLKEFICIYFFYSNIYFLCSELINNVNEIPLNWTDMKFLERKLWSKYKTIMIM